MSEQDSKKRIADANSTQPSPLFFSISLSLSHFIFFSFNFFLSSLLFLWSFVCVSPVALFSTASSMLQNNKDRPLSFTQTPELNDQHWKRKEHPWMNQREKKRKWAKTFVNRGSMKGWSLNKKKLFENNIKFVYFKRLFLSKISLVNSERNWRRTIDKVHKWSTIPCEPK